MRFLGIAALLAGTAALAAPARATDCPGNPGYVLSLPATVGLGQTFTTCLEAPAGSLAFVMISPEPGPYMTKFGPLCVGVPFFNVWPILVPETGAVCVDHFVACDDSYDGVTGYFQFVAVGPQPGQVGLSNGASLTAMDTGSCLPPGSFYTYTQGGWGTNCSGNNPGCFRDAHFPEAFPQGLVLGDADGDDADGHFALVLTSSSAVAAFLPAGGTAGALTQDLVNPVSGSPAGVLASQLAAAKLSVGFDDAGSFDALKSNDLIKLGDLLYSGGVHAALLGKPVRDVIALADQAISGELAEPFDVDGDLLGELVFSDLVQALTVLNENFVGGQSNHGNLKLP